MKWETVIGLEVHAELSTATKIFCSCPVSFREKPNTCICEVCTGMPGALPSLNEKVVDYAVRTGLALGCDINRHTRFDRKNYFYPDLPKAYQISQLYAPICTNGSLEIGGGKRIGIHELHMEEDAGKLLHGEEGKKTLIDYNRAGVPLIEIVTEPDMRSAEEARQFLDNLKSILEYTKVSDCKMQEGSLRADVNVSVRRYGEAELGTRTEMKNLNSFHAIKRAIEYESRRQIDLLEGGSAVTQQTRRWDDRLAKSYVMRSKEDAMDYKYFPEPDLPELIISEDKLNKIKSETPELPEEKKRRYRNELGLGEYDTELICSDLSLVRFFEKAVDLGADPKQTANWLLSEVLRMVGDGEEIPLKAESFVKIISLVSENKISRSTGKAVLEKAFSEGIDPEEYIDKNNLFQISDISDIEKALKRVIEENPKSVSEYRGGKEKAFKYIVGQSMKALGGKADARLVGSLLHKLLDR